MQNLMAILNKKKEKLCVLFAYLFNKKLNKKNDAKRTNSATFIGVK
jgi:hypothetical protein